MAKLIKKSARPVELNKTQLSEYKEAFTYFDSDQDGKINAVQFSHVSRASMCTGRSPDAHLCWPQVIRSLGCNPTERELRVMHRTIEHSYRGLITFANFVDLMSTLVLPNTKEPYQYNKFIKKAFKVRLAAAAVRSEQASNLTRFGVGGRHLTSTAATVTMARLRLRIYVW